MITLYFVCILPSFIFTLLVIKAESGGVTVGQLFGCVIMSIVPAMNVGITLIGCVYVLHKVGSKITRSKFMNKKVL